MALWRKTRRRRCVNHLITMTTDFGGTHYQGILEGVIHSLNPEARVVSITRYVRPQDTRGAAFVMKATLPFYLYGIHLGIVFPTVGTPGSRSIVVRCERGILLGPDNGILMPAARELGLEAVYEVSNPRYWLSTPSNTFLAVEIYAPLAAYLSMGLSPEEVGPQIDQWAEMEETHYTTSGASLEGEVVYIDNFGNIITNIPSREVARVAGYNDLLEVEVDGRSLRLPLLKSYGYAPKGGILATVNSNGFLEIAAYCDSASRLLGVEDYGKVRMRLAQRKEVLKAVSP